MEDAIVGKLHALLSQGITTEAELVYLLVQVRKLYQSRKAKLPPYLALFCAWVVHARLSYGTWAECALEMRNRAIPSFEFQRGLEAVLQAEGLPHPNWPNAVQLLGEVLRDCPLEPDGDDCRLFVEPLPGVPGAWAWYSKLKQ